MSSMSEDASRNAAFNAAAHAKVHHALWEDILQFTPEKAGHIRRGGIREGAGRDLAETQRMLEKIPPSQRAGVDGQSAAHNAKEYLSNKDASHIEPHSQGGSTRSDNLKWEAQSTNRARGDQPMTKQEQIGLDIKAQVDNLTGALGAGLKAAPRGAAIGAMTTVPFALLRNALRVVRGELSPQEAAAETAKETATGGAVGAVTAFTVTTVATACPPIAMALTALSPALLVVGGAGMVYQFFQLLDDHKQQVSFYYEAMTQQQLDDLRQVEDNLIDEHEKTLAAIGQVQVISEAIVSRPREAGIEGALKRCLESSQIVRSLGNASRTSTPKLKAMDQNVLPPCTE